MWKGGGCGHQRGREARGVPGGMSEEQVEGVGVQNYKVFRGPKLFSSIFSNFDLWEQCLSVCHIKTMSLNKGQCHY